MRFKAYLHFDHYDEDGNVRARSRSLPVASIMVEGGTSRRIDFKSTSDISLISELEQARTYKNIVVYLSGTKDNRDALATVNLMNANSNKWDLEILLVIERFARDKMTDGVGLFDEFAVVKYPPMNAIKNTVMVTFELYEPRLGQGDVKNHMIRGGKPL